jgi:tripartite ATP-independent transporter DctM subunit
MPILILVGFRMGVFTATEIAAVACAYSLIVGLFVYRTLTWKGLPEILLTTGRETAAILVIAAGAAPFGWILGVEQAPQHVAELLTSISREPWIILLILNISLLIAGMFMETLAIMIILVPILIPLLTELQINLLHFGIVLLVNLVIGQITPPVGVLMFVASSVSKTHLGLIVKEIGPFVFALIAALALLTYLPWLSLWLPEFLKQ